jgi:hypothetical protein
MNELLKIDCGALALHQNAEPRHAVSTGAGVVVVSSEAAEPDSQAIPLEHVDDRGGGCSTSGAGTSLQRVPPPGLPIKTGDGSVILVPRLPIPGANGPQRTLKDLASMIRGTDANCIEYGKRTKYLARKTIECAVTCGGYLRQAKVSEEMPEGGFTRWVQKACNVNPRSARNYMRLHTWVTSHRTEILKAKPSSLRQFYILAGILPEDGSKKLHNDKYDELSKLRRLVSRVLTEATGHRDYVKVEKLWQVLEPLAPLLREVSTDVTKKRQHVSPSRTD